MSIQIQALVAMITRRADAACEAMQERANEFQALDAAVSAALADAAARVQTARKSAEAAIQASALAIAAGLETLAAGCQDAAGAVSALADDQAAGVAEFAGAVLGAGVSAPAAEPAAAEPAPASKPKRVRKPRAEAVAVAACSPVASGVLTQDQRDTVELVAGVAVRATVKVRANGETVTLHYQDGDAEASETLTGASFPAVVAALQTFGCRVL
jgi:hypothetical protein